MRVADVFTKRVRSISVVMFVAATVSLTVFSSVAFAGGGAGGGGSGGGGGRSWWSKNGWGWRLFPVSGGGPSGGIKDGSWAVAQSVCRGDSTNVVVFGVVGPNAGDSGFRGYEFHTIWYSPFVYQNYKGDNGYPWVTMAAAKAKFYSIDPANRAGLVWGGTGNGVAWMCWEDNPGWNTSGNTVLNKTSIAPGQTATWTHTIKNDGPSTTSKAIVSTTTRTKTGVASVTGNSSTRTAGVASGGSIRSFQTTFTAIPSDAGKTICERINWTPNSSSSNSTESTGYDCVTVSYSYDLHPTIATGTNVMTPGQEVKGVDAAVRNAGLTPTQANSATAVVRFVIPQVGGNLLRSSEGATTLSDNAGYGCKVAAAVASGITNCTDALWNKPGGQIFGANTTTSLITNTTDTQIASASLKLGDRVCYISIVNRYGVGMDTFDWRHSAPKCVIVGKLPLMQVWGNDVRVGSPFTDVDTVSPFPVSTVAKNGIVRGGYGTFGGQIKGTWGEYGVFGVVQTNPALDSVVTFGSGSGLNSPLTFANRTGSPLGAYAQPSSTGTIPDVYGYLKGINLAAAGLSMPAATGSRTISSYMPNTILVVNGVATINANIVGPATAPNDKALTQMIIVAKSIKINSNVSRVDAWLIASGTTPDGTIDTCPDKLDVSGRLTTSTGPNSCDTVLTVTGPIMARKMTNQRTGGSADTGEPAEIYNMRSDAYLWAYNVAQASNTLHTVYTQELPPRY